MRIAEPLTFVSTRAELVAAGLCNSTITRKMHRGELVQLRPGIFCPSSIYNSLRPAERYPYAIAAYAKQNPDAIFSHRSAAWLHGLSVIASENLVDILAGSNTRGRAQGIIKHYTVKPSVPIAYISGTVRATSLLQTLDDCARYLELSESVCIINSALNRQLTTSEAVEERLYRLKGRGARRARATLPYLSSLCESPGETLLLIAIIDGGLPRPAQQVNVVVGGRVYRPDFLYEDEKVIVEFDGHIKYTDYGPTDRAVMSERRREKQLQNQGWIVLRYSWAQVRNHPEQVASEIAAMLELRRGALL